MTPDQAIAIKVRLDTAKMALVAAIEVVAGCDRVENTIRVDLDLHQALRFASNAAGICGNVIADGLVRIGSLSDTKSDTKDFSGTADGR